MPLHAPLQPEKVEPAAGVAVRVTLVPLVTDALQVGPQLIQPGQELTVPLLLPSLLMVSKDVGGLVVTRLVLKLALIVVFAFIVTVQSPVPLHPPPDQPSKVDPAAAVAERDTTVPGL